MSQAIALFGASSGIATAVGRLYARDGHELVLVGRDAGALNAMAADLRVRGAPGTRVVIADFLRLTDLAATVATAWDAFGGIDIALVAYGTLVPQADAERDPGAAAGMLAANFTSPAILLNELATRFEARGRGTIAAITSVAGDRGRKSNYVYGAAKGGLQRLLEGLAHRLAKAGVAVVDIRPGFVATRMTEHLDRSGPLWARPDAVARDIVRAIGRRQAVCYTPAFWRLVMLIVRNVPRGVFHRTAL
jgi:short-subunit dehydrogenase